MDPKMEAQIDKKQQKCEILTTFYCYCTREYPRYMGRRSVVTDHLFSVRLQGCEITYVNTLTVEDTGTYNY